ncbi:ribonuclease BN [Kitasatospora sp. NPDC097643]|uniref:YhjD/YihY/BrkB family envelope integrity protein n=1 Tax=Kitasatospora sp. NPDC097643 TaxID=3157230 RepID=UPI003331D418
MNRPGDSSDADADADGPDRPGTGGRSRLTGLTRAAADLPTRVPVLGRMLRRLNEVNTMEAAARLAAQVFLAALPLLIVAAAFTPKPVKNLVADDFKALMGDSAPVEEVRRTFAAHGTTGQSFGAVGIVVTLLSATALSRAIQRICERCWDLPKGGARLTAWRWLAWLLGWLAVLLLQAPLRHGFGAGAWVGVLLSLTASVLLWWWTQHLLLGGRIGWLPLLPGAVLAGGGMVAFLHASRLVTPQSLRRSIDQFGALGLVFTMLSWLIAVGCVLVVGLTLGQVIASSGPFPRWLGTPMAGDRS